MSTGVIFILGKGVSPILASGVKSTWPQGSSEPGFSNLAEQLHVTLHPDKIYLQHYTKGTKMVGAVIKPPCKNYTPP